MKQVYKKGSNVQQVFLKYLKYKKEAYSQWEFQNTSFNLNSFLETERNGPYIENLVQLL